MGQVKDGDKATGTFDSSEIGDPMAAGPGAAAPPVAPGQMTAEAAMAALWGRTCPDCGPTDYAGIVRHVAGLLDGVAGPRGGGPA